MAGGSSMLVKCLIYRATYVNLEFLDAVNTLEEEQGIREYRVKLENKILIR